jgi:hypothetical protein
LKSECEMAPQILHNKKIGINADIRYVRDN